MPDLFPIPAYLLESLQQYIPLLVGGLSVLNGTLMFLQKMHELWASFKPRRRQKSKNKRSTKRTDMNP